MSSQFALQAHGLQLIALTSFQDRKGKVMIHSVVGKRIIAILMGVTLLLGAFSSTGFAVQRRHKRHHHSRAKGAVINGKKGAVIGTGAGAGTGYLIQRHRNKRHRRHS
jgi:hypothetical protein